MVKYKLYTKSHTEKIVKTIDNGGGQFTAEEHVYAIEKEFEKHFINKPCIEVYQKLSVDWGGKVTCCCSDFDNFLVVGDINQSSFFDIWNNNSGLKIFGELLDKNLPRCLTLLAHVIMHMNNFKGAMGHSEAASQPCPSGHITANKRQNVILLKLPSQFLLSARSYGYLIKSL